DRLYGPSHDFDAAVLGIPGDVGLGYLGPLAALTGLTPPRDPAAVARLFADSMPVAFLYHARGVQGMNRRVHGVRMDLRCELVTVHDWGVSQWSGERAARLRCASALGAGGPTFHPSRPRKVAWSWPRQ